MLVKDAVPLPAPLIEVVKNYLIIKKAATIWYLTKKTGSATVLSMATILGMLPMVILSPFVVPMVNQWNKKGLLFLSSLNYTFLIFSPVNPIALIATIIDDIAMTAAPTAGSRMIPINDNTPAASGIATIL